jgi:MFS family permease
LASVILAKAIPQYGEKVITVLSSFILLISCGFLLFLNIRSPLILVIIFTFIMGFGFGGGFTTLTIVVQALVGYNKRGAATASNSLIRTLGQTIGVSIFGSIFNSNIVSYFSNIGIKGVNPENLYSQPDLSGSISGELIRASVNSGIQLVFIVTIVIAAVSLALSFLLGNTLRGSSSD